MFEGSIMNTKSHCNKTGQPLPSIKPLLASRVKCSRHQNQTLGMETSPPKKVIAMVANVAAFGLRGSFQNAGTEVKSS